MGFTTILASTFLGEGAFLVGCFLGVIAFLDTAAFLGDDAFLTIFFIS
jgi:hypothetical protein